MRPILDRLPEFEYRDNPVADWLTLWSDLELLRVRNILEKWYLELSPDTCQDSSLDYLASLLGFSGVYWDTKWSVLVKRTILSNTSKLWLTRGTKAGLTLILSILVESSKVWVNGNLTLPFPMSKAFERNDLRLYIRLPLTYSENGSQFYQVKRIIEGYVPVILETGVVYEHHYCGFSRIGQPMFTI